MREYQERVMAKLREQIAQNQERGLRVRMRMLREASLERTARFVMESFR